MSGATRGPYNAAVMEAYEGEIFGEAFLRRLAEGREDRRERDKLIKLAELEVRTRHTMEASFDGLARDRDVDAVVAAARRLASEKAGLHWRGLMENFVQEFRPFAEAYDRLAREAPASHREALGFLAAHERALLVFAERELAGDGDALEGISALLQKTGQHDVRRAASGLRPPPPT